MRRGIAIVLCLLACGDPAPSDPVRSTVTVDWTAGAVADGEHPVTLTVTVRDAGGTPLAGRVVTVAAPDDVVVGAVGPTDGDGITSAALTSVVAGPKVIDVSVDGVVLASIEVAFVAGPVAGLAFVVQPASGELGSYLPTFQVGFADAFDNIVTTETETITVVLVANNAGAYAVGDRTVDAVDGVSTFSQVGVNRVGTGLVLRAQSGMTPTRDSVAFDVGYGEPTSASTLVASPGTSVADGVSGVDVTVTLKNSGGIVIPGYAVALSAGGGGTVFYPGAGGQSDAQGQFRATLTSTSVGVSTVTATAGSLMLAAPVTFVDPPCIPQLPGGPGTILGAHADSIVVADFDGDGHRDAAIMHRTSDIDSVSIVRGAGSGRFHAPTLIPIGSSLEAIAKGDLDSDGDIDLALVGGFDKTLHVLLNQGVGQFVAVPLATLPYSAFDIDIIDFNNDLKLDLVTRSDYVVMTAIGNGDGTFQTAVEYVTDSPQFSDPSATIQVARLDGDMTYDLFSTGNGTYTVLLGNANGTFTLKPSVAGYGDYESVAIVDYDGDAIADVVGGLYYMHGNGDGTFGSATNLGEPFAGGDAGQAADLDGDNKQDLVVAFSKPGVHGVRILHGNGNGTFEAPQDIALGRFISALAIDDFDEDGNADVLVVQYGTHSTINLLRGTGTGTVIGGARFFGDSVGSERALFMPVAGDFNGNGTLDFFAMNNVTRNWGLQLAAQDGTLTATATHSLTTVDDAAIGDYDSDGNLDVLTLGGGLQWLRGNGNGTLQTPAVSTMPTGWATTLRVARLDVGTTDDVAFVNPLDGNVTVAFGTGAGAWTGAVQYTVATNPVHVEVADIEADGDRDLVVASRNGQAVTVLTNNGSGVFTAAGSLVSSGKPASIAVGDIDGDGFADILAGDLDLKTVGFFKGNGAGGFAAEVRIPLGVTSFRMTLRDLDANGDLDVLVSADGLYVFRGAAGATFLPPLLYDTGVSGDLLFADFDMDGELDVMGTHRTFPEPGFTVAYNNGCQ